MNIKDYVKKEENYIVELRRYFHSHPEESLKEYNTCKRIEEELDKSSIPHRRVGETGVYAWIDGCADDGINRTIALRADMDALKMQDLKDVPYRSQNDGLCHACGHDSHTAVLLVAAKILNEKKNEFSGQIRLFFQQAEEIGAGARLFVKEGLMEGVGRVYGSHISSQIKSGCVSLTPGPNNASCDHFTIKVTGKGAHVSKPHLGVDALYTAAQIIVAEQSIVARNTNPVDTVVVGIGLCNAGTAYNIIAEHAVIEGTTRCFSPETREFTNRRVREIAESVAAANGASVEIEFEDFAAPLINDEDAAREVSAIAERIIPAENIIHNLEKSLGADDFADYLAKAKGVYAFIGTRNEENPNTAVPQHHGLFDIDESAMLTSCNLYVDYALEYLQGKTGNDK
jgi:amidohydrolase